MENVKVTCSSYMFRRREQRKTGGSIVWEKVSCGKTSCKKCGGFRRVHGPYAYLHFYDADHRKAWKSEKNILGKLLQNYRVLLRRSYRKDSNASIET